MATARPASRPLITSAASPRMARQNASICLRCPSQVMAVGLEAPPQCDGRSLRPFLEGGTPVDWRREVHWEYDFRDPVEQRPETALGLASDQCTLNVIRDRQYKYVHFTALPPLLFDLEADPQELVNLAEDPAHASVVLAYAQKMLSWRMRNDERTLTGMFLTKDGVVERRR